MVKNKVGGNKAKKFGRKHILGDNEPVKVRFTKEEGEMYAIIVKHYGQGRMEVLCEDDKLRSCIIRKKFRGRHRHHNKASIGYFIMVGLREWETSKEKETCDLLETYDDQEKEKLMQQQPHVPFNNMLKRCNEMCGGSNEHDDLNDIVEFTNLDNNDIINENMNDNIDHGGGCDDDDDDGIDIDEI